jgi:adenylyltransferase/sulfurtransferase
MTADRYARQQLIEWWDQERLRNARVLVAGAGALGNEVLKNLALVGVGHLLVIDFDHVEASNLSRTTLFRESDIGRSKVEVAAETLARLNPEVTVQTINGNLFYDVGLGYYRHSDLAIGCLDNLAARSQVGRSCGLADIPYLDGGMWSLGGEARWFFAQNGPCFDCTLSIDDIERADERRSRPDWQETEQASTVATTASIIGGLLAQEAIKWLCGYPIMAGKAIVYNGQALTLHRTELTRNPDCTFSHLPYQSVIELSEDIATLTPRQLLEMGRRELEHQGPLENSLPATISPDPNVFLELGRDFLLALQCPNCGQHQEINQHWGQVPERERACPSCGTARRAEVIRAIDESSPYIDRSLSDLGVPHREVLAVHTSGRLVLYEIN